jgi:small subunit ribosomal protein S23
MTSTKAYDIARGEFYALRHEEDVERRIAKEEALSTGAYFGKSVLEIGMDLEDKYYEEWKAWALKQVELLNQQKDAAYTNFDIPEEGETATAPDLDHTETEAPSTAEA